MSFGTVELDPLQARPGQLLPAPQTPAGDALRLVQFAEPIRQQNLEALRALGLEPLHYYPQGAYLVWGGPAALAQARQMTAVRWAGDFAPTWRLSADLAGRSGLIDQVLLHYYDDGQRASLLAAVVAAGGWLLREHPAQPDGRFREAVLILPATALPAVAALPQVLWLGYQSPEPGLEDEMSAQIVAGNVDQDGIPLPGYLAFLNGLGLDGSGVPWAVIDDGVDLDHPDLISRITGGYDFPGCTPGSAPGADGPGGGHGSHVAGILAGTGAGGFADLQGFAYGVGVAPGASLVALNPLCGPPAPWPPAGGWPELSRQALLAGAIGANASWTTSEGPRHGYQASERTFDFMVRDGNFDTPDIAEPFPIVFSAGNSGPGAATLTSPKEAKNSITVGATLNHRSGPIDRLAGFSSRGPAVDGRLLPTVVAPGELIASTRRRAGGIYCNSPIPDSDGLYAYCAGTSMAAPHVSGLAALLVQWWRDSGRTPDPSPAMLKNLLVVGARPLVDGDLRPDDGQGFGLAGLPPSLLDPALPWQAIDQSQSLDEPGQRHRFAFRAGLPDQPVRVLLSWSDAPGAIGARPALVNDLDLRLRTANASLLGNQIGTDGSMPGGTPDRLNNIELIHLAAPGSDSFVVEVSAHALPGDGVPLQGDETDQDYALYCSNCVPAAAFEASVQQASSAVCTPGQASFEVDVQAIGAHQSTVALDLAGLPAGLTGTLQPASLDALPAQLSVLVSGNVPGAHRLELLLESPQHAQRLPLPLLLADTVPDPVSPFSPGDGASGIGLRPTLRWIAIGQPGGFRLELAEQADFAAPLLDVLVNGSSYTLPFDLPPSSTWFWRVRASNPCGEGLPGPVFQFSTGPAPGSCPLGQRAILLWRDPITADSPGWTHQSAVGSDNWAVSDLRQLSPTLSWRGRPGFGQSDQRLRSPLLRLPAGEPALLRFSHWRGLEVRDDSRCFDGAQLFTDTAGNDLQLLPLQSFLLGAPERLLDTGNPAAGTPAWCGQHEFSPVVAELSAFAGQSLRLGFRLTSDSLRAEEGWYIDDVEVLNCVDEDRLFRSGMGPEAH